MQAITTKVLPPTMHKGTRIKAETASGISITLSWDYSGDELENAWRAVEALIVEKLNDGWRGDYVAGALPHGYAFVRADDDSRALA